jgi:hypothetical protein
LRSICLLFVIALSLAVASCGGSGSPDHPTTTSSGTAPGPTGPATASKPGRDTPRAPASVRGSISFLETSFFGAKSQVTYFAVRPGGGSPLAQAQRCVEENLSKAPSAYCFAFSSKRALRYSRISRRPPAKMLRPCWTAYWGKPKGRRAIGSASNAAAAGLHCPGAEASAG